jgi:hypothetical protein
VRTIFVSLLLLAGVGLIYFFFFYGTLYTNSQFGYSVLVRKPWHLSSLIANARHDGSEYAYVSDFDKESEGAFATEVDAGNAPLTDPDWKHVIVIQPSTALLCDPKNSNTEIGQASKQINLGNGVTGCEVDYRKIENFNAKGLANTLAVYIPVPFGVDSSLSGLKSMEISIANVPLGDYAERDFETLVNSFKWLQN